MSQHWKHTYGSLLNTTQTIQSAIQCIDRCAEAEKPLLCAGCPNCSIPRSLFRVRCRLQVCSRVIFELHHMLSSPSAKSRWRARTFFLNSVWSLSQRMAASPLSGDELWSGQHLSRTDLTSRYHELTCSAHQASSEWKATRSQYSAQHSTHPPSPVRPASECQDISVRRSRRWGGISVS